MMLNRFFKYLVIGMGFVATLLLSACDSHNEQEHDSKHLRVGMNTWPGYEPFMLAKEKGYLNENIHISRVDSATDVIKAFRSNVIDVACITLDEAIILQNRMDEKIQIIAIMDFSTGGDVVIANKSIQNMDDLKGKRVGIEPGALGAFIISRAVDLTDNLDIHDIKIINISYEHHENAFKAGQVDAIVTFEPIKTKLLQGDAHVIFDSTQIPGEILDVIVVKEKLITNNHDTLQALIDGWYKAIESIRLNHQESMMSMAKYEGITLKEFEIAYSGITVPSRKENIVFFKEKLEITINKVQKVLLQKNIIEQKTLEKLNFTPQFIEHHSL